MSTKRKVLLLDNNQPLSERLADFLSKQQIETEHFKLGKKLIGRAKNLSKEVIICNYQMKDMDGFEFLTLFRKRNQTTPIIFISSYHNIQFVVKCMRKGAFDYVTDPVQPEEVMHTLSNAFNAIENSGKSKPSQNKKNLTFVKGNSDYAQQLEKHIALVSPTDLTVVIEGETGTGKEIVARRVHLNSKRASANFVALDCGAIPKELAGSELFGHLKGAFTGAIENKKGCFEEAHNGTLFLDEIGNLSFENQLKLLRVLQERKVKPIGSNRTKKVNIRLVVATNENLKKMVDKGDFREDLFYRLNEFKIELNPLHKRKKDLLEFANFFLDQANHELNKNIKGFTKKAEDLMLSYSWPGNLRELKNTIKRAVLLCNGIEISNSHISIAPTKQNEKVEFENFNLKDAIEKTERKLIQEVLEKTRFNKSKSAELLGIDRKTLYSKIDYYKI